MEYIVKTTVKKDTEWGVYIVRTYINGVYQAGCDCEADTRKEALEIAEEIKSDIEKRISENRYTNIQTSNNIDSMNENQKHEYFRTRFGSSYNEDLGEVIEHEYTTPEEREAVETYIKNKIGVDFETTDDNGEGAIVIFEMSIADYGLFKDFLKQNKYI